MTGLIESYSVILIAFTCMVLQHSTVFSHTPSTPPPTLHCCCWCVCGCYVTFLVVPQVEEHLRIPCPTQNWIVGDKLVTTGNLMKKLCDYGIKKDSKEPPLYLYVVHPKKANVSREDLMRVGVTRATTAHSSQGPGVCLCVCACVCVCVMCVYVCKVCVYVC